MKRIATQLFILFLLGILTQLNAQEQYRDIIERALTVNYIFEGIVIETNPYKITDDKFVYTSNVIQITKVFKGDLSCGTVELISEGGEVDDYKCRVSHNLNLEEGTSGLFLCNLTGKELSTVDFYSESNYQKLEAYYENQSLVRYSYENNKLVGYDLWQKIDSLAALYDMAKYVGQFQFVDCNNQRLLTEGK